jgi:hypothetical protein
MDTVMARETLEAFADGALSPEEAARIVLHLADCPGDAAYVDALMEVNALVAAAYAEPLHQAVPERIRAAIFPERPVAAPAAARRGRPADPRGGWRALAARPWARLAGWAALAASAALAVGLAIGPVGDGRQVQIASADAVDEALREALETRPSGPVGGAPAAARLTLIATFLDGDGRPCREYEILDAAEDALTQGIACRTPDQGWATEVAVASRLAPDVDRGEAFVPAEGAQAGALDGALDRLGAGMLMTPDEERELIEAGWRR